MQARESKAREAVESDERTRDVDFSIATQSKPGKARRRDSRPIDRRALERGIRRAIVKEADDCLVNIRSVGQGITGRENLAIALQGQSNHDSPEASVETRVERPVSAQANHTRPRFPTVLSEAATDNDSSIGLNTESVNPRVRCEAGIEGGVQSAIVIKT